LEKGTFSSRIRSFKHLRGRDSRDRRIFLPEAVPWQELARSLQLATYNGLKLSEFSAVCESVRKNYLDMTRFKFFIVVNQGGAA
jgi:hypothetical protein